MSQDLTRVRNIGIAAHIDAGKTTTTERILYYARRTHRMGEVDDGTTTTDYDEQEQQRGITIYSAAVTVPWRDHTINLIDTPGHVDFTAEVERSLRVLDGMVAVFDAREGVEAQSETVWRQADKYHVPRICFINKMDRTGADFEQAVDSIRKRLAANPLVLEWPIGAADSLSGVVDLIEMKALYYETQQMGATFTVSDIPEDLRSQVLPWRQRLLEAVAESCDSLLEKYLHGAAIDGAELRGAIRAATIRREVAPVLCGSALKFIGVQPLLDAVCDYLPSPVDVPPIRAADARRPEVEHEIRCDPSGPFAALVFKVVAEKPVDLYFLRIYSGTLRPNTRALNAGTGEKENIARIFRMFAKRRDQLDTALAGDIVAVIGPKNTLTGHTLCDPRHPVLLEPIAFPETVISVSVEPKSSKDRDKLLAALRALERQDPTVAISCNEETGQTLVAGMGELHLEVLVQRLRAEMNVDVLVGKPRVSYRETVSAVGEAEVRFQRQIGGREHFALVRLRIEPRAHVAGRAPYEIRVACPLDALDSAFLRAIETGIADAAHSGILGGYPVIDWQATIVGGEQRDAASTELAFENAGRLAFYEAMKASNPVLLQPIMDVEVATPEAYVGAIMNDLNGRRAVVRENVIRGDHHIISAEVPLAEMFGYVTRLRSLSQGRATSSMSPSHYSQVTDAERRILLG